MLLLQYTATEKGGSGHNPLKTRLETHMLCLFFFLHRGALRQKHIPNVTCHRQSDLENDGYHYFTKSSNSSDDFTERFEKTTDLYKVIQCIPLNVDPVTITGPSSSERATGTLPSHASRRVPSYVGLPVLG